MHSIFSAMLAAVAFYGLAYSFVMGTLELKRGWR